MAVGSPIVSALSGQVDLREEVNNRQDKHNGKNYYSRDTYSTGRSFLRTSLPTMLERMKTGIKRGNIYQDIKPAIVANPKDIVKVS